MYDAANGSDKSFRLRSFFFCACPRFEGSTFSFLRTQCHLNTDGHSGVCLMVIPVSVSWTSGGGHYQFPVRKLGKFRLLRECVWSRSFKIKFL
jgi:hypothetical protein